MEHQDCPGEFMFSVVASILTQIWNFCSTELILTSISTAGIFIILFFCKQEDDFTLDNSMYQGYDQE
jgi:hypothetical protein